MVRPPVNEFRLPEKRHVANVFVDLCGSTAAGEALKDTQHLFGLLDRWQRLTAFLFCNYGGKIGASDSDMVMGYFLGSEAGNLSMSRALLAACKIREQTIAFGQENGTPLDVHIGLHCGDVEVGLIGPTIRHNITTIGPPVNIAARLQSKAGRGEVFASADLVSAAKVGWEGAHAGLLQLKGVSNPTECFRITSVVVPSGCADEVTESDWIGATLEAQALENIGKNDQALALSKMALRCQSPPGGLPPELSLLPTEICIRSHIGMRQPREARSLIDSYARRAIELSAYRQAARASFYLAWSLMQLSDFGGAIVAFKDARKGYEKYGSGRDVADAYYYAGLCHQFLNQPRQSSEMFQLAKERYYQFVTQQEADPVEVGKACLELSMLLQDEPAKATEVLAKAAKIFDETCQFRYLVTALLNLSCVANGMLRPTHAENYARKALELAWDFDPVEGVGLALGNIAAALENRGDYKQAINFYYQALDVARESNDDGRYEELSRRLRRVKLHIFGVEP